MGLNELIGQLRGAKFYYRGNPISLVEETGSSLEVCFIGEREEMPDNILALCNSIIHVFRQANIKLLVSDSDDPEEIGSGIMMEDVLYLCTDDVAVYSISCKHYNYTHGKKALIKIHTEKPVLIAGYNPKEIFRAVKAYVEVL